MKASSFLLSCIIAILCFSCNTTDKSFEQQSNPFNTENKELLFAQIESAVDSTIKATNIEYQEYTIKGYLKWDSLTNVLFSPENFIHTSDNDWAKNENGIIEYLNWHLWNTITPYISEQCVLDKMNVEIALTDSLLTAQYLWFNSHFDTTEEPIGTASQLKYYALEKEMLMIQNSNLCELLVAFTDSTYQRTIPHQITISILQKANSHILNNRIPYFKDDTIYNEKIDKANFVKENTAWDNLLSQRKLISGLISNDAKTAFDLGTYRLMFNRLRQLKNEFEAYESQSRDMKSIALSDSCTYEELMTYPNFTTKWNEYLKQFE